MKRQYSIDTVNGETILTSNAGMNWQIGSNKELSKNEKLAAEYIEVNNKMSLHDAAKQASSIFNISPLSARLAWKKLY